MPDAGIVGHASLLRTLDRRLGEWVCENFAEDPETGDQDKLLRIAQAVSHAVHLKHTCIDLGVYKDLSEPILDSLLAGISCKDVTRLVTDKVRPLCASADGQRVWLQKYHAFECAVVQGLRDLQASQRLEIITGGPGTGKTWTAAQRIQQELEKNPQCAIALAAPTGKAANNMMNALARTPGFAALDHGLKGLTIHSLLGMNGRSPKPRRDTRNPLACDLLIIDEASMIDLPMMYRLLQAIPSTARLLLLGDKDQLASVEAGSVLGDICRAFEGQCVTTLAESRRFADSPEIGSLATALNNGKVPDMKANQKVRVHDLRAEKPWEPAWLAAAIARYEERQALIRTGTAIGTLLDWQARFQILCALREGPQGVAGINAMVEKALGSKAGGWYAGRPVMVTQNAHDRKLYNGDIGMVLPVSVDGQSVDTAGALKACFRVDGQVKAVSLAQMPAHDTCYAITVHKSQGSEYDHVLIVLPAEAQQVANNPVLTRELVYTAVTRAKSSIDIWCGEGVLKAAATKTTQRMSGLQALLGQGIA